MPDVEETQVVEEEPVQEEPEAKEENSLQKELEELRQALAQRDERIAEMEGQIAALEGELQQARTDLAERDRQLGSLKEELEAAVARFREVVLESAPEVPQELVRGETVQEVERAFQSARQMVERIRSQVEAKLSRERVPTGSPTRSAPDLSSMSAREKILHALSRR